MEVGKDTRAEQSKVLVNKLATVSKTLCGQAMEVIDSSKCLDLESIITSNGISVKEFKARQSDHIPIDETQYK